MGSGTSTCLAEQVPQLALDAMVLAAAAPAGSCSHTDCHYAALLLAALPHLVTEEVIELAVHGYYDAVPGDGRLADWQVGAMRDAMRKALAAALGGDA